MTARTLPALGRRWALLTTVLVLPLSGCRGFGDRLEAKHIPQYGEIDPHQARELQMTTMPSYVVEPSDELEVTIRPAIGDFSQSSVNVQADGNIDLGFLGDVYVAGLTLAQVEQKIAQTVAAQGGPDRTGRTHRVSVRLTGSASKNYYVIGTVTTQGKFPITGKETVLDGILAAGLKTNSLPQKAYLVRPQPAGTPDLILKIDWIGIKERGDTLTNYQLFPGDRIIVPGTRPPGAIRALLGG